MSEQRASVFQVGDIMPLYKRKEDDDWVKRCTRMEVVGETQRQT
jgi:hypothetical protein